MPETETPIPLVFVANLDEAQTLVMTATWLPRITPRTTIHAWIKSRPTLEAISATQNGASMALQHFNIWIEERAVPVPPNHWIIYPSADSDWFMRLITEQHIL